MKKTSSSEHGVALVTTMIILAVMAVVAVAFMQTTTVDRFSARSVANYTRAKLAAEAGLAAAAATLGRAMTNDTFIVVANTNRQLFIGNGVTNPPASADFSYAPAFSVSASLTNVVPPIVTGAVPATNVAGGILFTNSMPGGLSITSPAVSWVYMTNTDGTTNARFAYWVEDLGGRLDLAVVGTNTGSPEARRPTGTNPSEIALWALLNSNAASAATSGGAGDSLVTARSNIETPATARLADPAVTANMMADLASGLVHDTNEAAVIPFGFGYANQGQPKFDLNTNASSGSISNMVAAITNNLRNPTNPAIVFASTNRSGGMSGERYVNALAAAMIDYVDTDNNPTTTNAGGGAVRGIEGLPFVTETATAIQWMAHGTNIPGFDGRNAVWADEIHVENYVEIWNPTDREFSGTLDITFTNAYHGGSINGFPLDMTITASTANATVTNTLGFSNNQYRITVTPSLLPNEYRVFSLGTNIFRFKVANSAAAASDPNYQNGAKASAGGKIYYGSKANNRAQNFFGNNLTVAAGGIVYDRIFDIERRGGRDLLCKQFNANEAPDWGNNVAASRIYAGLNQSVASLPGDPRVGFYLTATNAAQGYTNNLPSNPGSSMGFRNDGKSSAGTNYITDPSAWLDAGHTNSPLNSNRITAAVRPSTNRQTTAHTNDFVQRLNNTGSWTNVLELGNIFDPVAWNVPTNTPHILSSHTAAGNGTSSLTNGGGNTFRIGRVEHPRFTNDGLRASQLLDIFAVGPKVGNAVVSRVPGRINLNTATTNTLRALAAGVRHAVDASMRPANLDVPVAAVSAFVNGVTNFRSQRPFFSTSQLNLISTNAAGAADWVNGAVFGRTNLLGATAWGDRAAEEWFSRIYHLSTVRSRNFLVHVVGQAVLTNNPSTVLSSSKQVFQIYAQPLRGPDGLTTNTAVRTIRQWEL